MWQDIDQSHVIVIGAGSAGLATAANLQARGMHVTVLERGTKPGQSWLQRRENLRLNTIRGLSALPGRSIDRSAGTWPSGAEYARYLHTYATQHEVRIRHNCDVVQVAHGRRANWDVRLADGDTIPADVVVVATGWAAEPHIPLWPGEFTKKLLHAADYRSPEDFAGASVLVVGSGNSGAEIAVELLGTAAEVRMAVRTPPLLVPADPKLHRVGALFWWLPEDLVDKLSISTHRSHYRDLAEHGLPIPTEGVHARFNRDGTSPTADRGFADAVRSGRLTITAAVAALTGDGVQLANGQEERPDVVIAATGYRPAFAGLVGHLGVLDERGFPAKQEEALYFVGAPSLRGDLHVHGQQARRVARAISTTPVNTKRTSDV